MSQSHDLGKKGEDLAVDHLRKSGYRIVRRNWTSGRNEIDIIAENNDFIVFVEVKTRSENFQVDPRDAVNREKQKSMIYCADNYIKWHNVTKECRFDVITVIMAEDSCKIDHIEYAFYPTLR
jgi:putative endonuclease